MTSDAQRIAERYPARRRPVWALVVVGPLVALLLVWAVWAGLSRASVGISAELYGFRVTSPSEVQVTLDVYRQDPSRAGHCTVAAKAASGQVVGETEVSVGPGAAQQQRVHGSVKTVEQAVTAFLKGCQLG